MQLGRHGEVEPIVLAAVEPPQKLDRLLPTASVVTKRLGTADSEIAHGPRAGATTELRERGSELRIDGHLDTRRG